MRASARASVVHGRRTGEDTASLRVQRLPTERWFDRRQRIERWRGCRCGRPPARRRRTSWPRAMCRTRTSLAPCAPPSRDSNSLLICVVPVRRAFVGNTATAGRPTDAGLGGHLASSTRLWRWNSARCTRTPGSRQPAIGKSRGLPVSCEGNSAIRPGNAGRATLDWNSKRGGIYTARILGLRSDFESPRIRGQELETQTGGSKRGDAAYISLVVSINAFDAKCLNDITENIARAVVESLASRARS